MTPFPLAARPPVRAVTALLLALAGASLIGCGQRDSGAPAAMTEAAPALSTAAMDTGAGAGAKSGAAPGADAATAAPRVYIAEEHTYRFAPEADRLKPLWQKHLDRCHRLGPAGCQVEEARLSADDDGLARSGSLIIRVANAQAGAFLAELEADTPRDHEIGRTDKTTEVIDTDARLANAEQLRTRLQSLRDTAAKLSDIVDLETRIADVQGRIEAARGQREYLRQQTEKTKIELSYTASGRATDGPTWEPVREALAETGSTLALTLGFIVRALTVLLPVGLVVGALVWAFRSLRRRARQGTATATAGPVVPPPPPLVRTPPPTG